IAEPPSGTSVSDTPSGPNLPAHPPQATTAVNDSVSVAGKSDGSSYFTVGTQEGLDQIETGVRRLDTSAEIGNTSVVRAVANTGEDNFNAARNLMSAD